MYFDAPYIYTVVVVYIYFPAEFPSDGVCLCLMQLAFTSLVYPALILGYMGQAAYLSQHHNFDSSYQIGFYIAVPGSTHRR
jgi:hypothetical protein